MRLKRGHLFGIIVATAIVSIISISLYQNQSATPPASPVQLVSYEWDVKAISWEHEYVELNITLYNPNDRVVDFTLGINPYDGDVYFGFSKQYDITLPGKTEEFFTKRVYYELLFNHHHANAIEIICGIYGEDDCVEELFFREFSSKE